MAQAHDRMRSLLQPLLRRLVSGLCRLGGTAIVQMNFRLLSQIATASTVLRALGASVGSGTHIASDICIFNWDDGRCRNLQVGSNVYIGPRCMFDLTSI